LKVSERIELNRYVASEIARRFSEPEAQDFLEAFKLSSGQVGWGDDASDVYRSALAKAPLNVVAEIIEDLGLQRLGGSPLVRQMPTIWETTNQLRAFVSHLSTEKLKATRLRDCLSTLGINAFVAHEDIEPTLEWQVQIERALHNSELFISMHTPGFSKSIWTQQEIGYAVGTGLKIIAVRMGEDPVGFISKNQALSRADKTAEQVSEEITAILRKDPILSKRMELSTMSDDLDDDISF